MGEDEYEFVYEWAPQPKRSSEAREIMQWWLSFLQSVLNLWDQGISMVMRIQIPDILATDEELKVGGYKHFEILNRSMLELASWTCAKNVTEALYLMIMVQSRDSEREDLMKYYERYDKDNIDMDKLRHLFYTEILENCVKNSKILS